MDLITTPPLEAPDDFYEALIEAHRDLSLAQSQALAAARGRGSDRASGSCSG